MIFVDTNYFLRFLLKDNKDQYLEVKSLFEEAAVGKIKLFTSIIVFFEIYWVLSSFYQKKKKEVVKTLKNILSLGFIDFENYETLFKTIQFFERNKLDLEDSYNLVYAKEMEAEAFKTFDQKLEF